MIWRRGPAVVTGAGSGMGRGLAWRLASEGIRVAAVDTQKDRLEEMAERAPSIVPAVCDVTDRAGLEATITRFESAAGPVETVVPAAATAPSGYLLSLDPDDMRRAMDVNYMGVVNTVRAVLPAMVERGTGDVILFGSLAAWLPSFRTGAYSATKAAVVSFAETLYEELRHTDAGRDIRIVCACPSAVDTPLMAGVEFPEEVRDRMKPTPTWRVLDSIERGLQDGEFLVFPSPAGTLWRIRRAFPGILWSVQRRIEP